MKPLLNRLIRRLGDLPPENLPVNRGRLLAFLLPYATSKRTQKAFEIIRKATKKRQNMVSYNSFKNNVKLEVWLRWLGRYLPIKHRYVLTRANHLRLRYIVPSVVVCLICLITITTGFVVQSGAVNMGAVSSLTYEVSGAEEKLASSQKRLQRYNTQEKTIVAFTPKAVPQPKEKTLKIGKGDTLAGVLQNAGVGASEAYKAVLAMEKYYDPRKIRPGQKIQVRFDPTDNPNTNKSAQYHFSEMKIDIDAIKSVSLKRTEDNGFESRILEKEVTSRLYTNKANIEVSLYGSAQKAGIPAPVIAQAIHIFSWDVDFQRDIRKGDVLEVMYEQIETPEGIKVKNGDIIYVRLDVNGHDIPVYRFKMDDGDIDYFTANGVSLRKALMQTPIDGARLSSGFGMRKHPVLGYNKMHKGVDFAAPRGTPIYAAGDGTIEKAGPWKSYGNYVRIRHNATLKTAYAHMKKFAKGIRNGTRVKQGQVIGYVGTTGRSTGPHLHYEVLQNGRQANPKKINLPQGETLKSTQLTAFKKHVKKLDRQYASLTKGTTLASSQKKKRTTMR